MFYCWFNGDTFDVCAQRTLTFRAINKTSGCRFHEAHFLVRVGCVKDWRKNEATVMDITWLNIWQA